jgi:DNA-binding XRE family transcriptional regulator
MKIKPRTSFTVFVKHLNQYSRKFIVTAKSEYFARQMVRELVSVHPLDQRRGTFDGTRVTINVNQLPDIEAEVFWITAAEESIIDSFDTMPTERVLQIAFGSTMRNLREHLEVSQRELAIQVGLRQPTIGVLERGETGVRLYNFVRIAHALGKNPDDLLRVVAEEYERLGSESQYTGRRAGAGQK